MPAFQPDPIDYRTPLMLAASAGDLCELFTCILDGADVNAKDHNGWTALTFACWFGHYEIVTQLLDSNAEPNTCESYDMIDTPLSIAS